MESLKNKNGFPKGLNLGDNMGKIVILDELTIGKIAAGEVVQRPASVVKELLENSLDAKATNIDIEIIEGGLRQIKVIDNGLGMDVNDAKLAFVRYATSKINNAKDLESISTMGFRGEALASIAAVSKILLKTKSSSMDAGISLELEEGIISSIAPVGFAQGTSIHVSNLFFNTPVRLKHMKTASTESNLIGEIVSKIALANPEIKIRLFNQGKLIFNGGNGGLLGNLAEIYGISSTKEMLELKFSQEGMKISGYISKPLFSRASRRYVDVFVNGRYVKNNIIVAAVIEAYHSILPTGRFPIAVIKLELNPSFVDVNVHPAKMEIKILDERMIFEKIRYVVKKTIVDAKANPVENLLKEKSLPINLDNPVLKALEAKTNKFVYPKNNPYVEELKNNFSKIANINENSALVNNKSKKEYKNLENISNFEEMNFLLTDKKNPFADLKFLNFLPPVYLMWQSSEGIYILDQQIACQKILYNKYVDSFNKKEKISKEILPACSISLTQKEIKTLKNNLSFIDKLGIKLEKFGESNYLLREAPFGLEKKREECFLKKVLKRIEDEGKNLKEKDLEWGFKIIVSCAVFSKTEIITKEKEAKILLDKLSTLKSPFLGIDKRPILICISQKELELRFKKD